jgi:hypothetical protein
VSARSLSEKYDFSGMTKQNQVIMFYALSAVPAGSGFAAAPEPA